MLVPIKCPLIEKENILLGMKECICRQKHLNLWACLLCVLFSHTTFYSPQQCAIVNLFHVLRVIHFTVYTAMFLVTFFDVHVMYIVTSRYTDKHTNTDLERENSLSKREQKSRSLNMVRTWLFFIAPHASMNILTFMHIEKTSREKKK